MKLLSIITFFCTFYLGQYFRFAHSSEVRLYQHFDASLKPRPMTQVQGDANNGERTLLFNELSKKRNGMYETENIKQDGQNVFSIYSYKTLVNRARRSPQTTETPKVPTGVSPAPGGLPSTPEAESSIPGGTTPSLERHPTVPPRHRRTPQIPEMPKSPAEAPTIPESLTSPSGGSSTVPEGAISKADHIPPMASRSRRSPQLPMPEMPKVPAGTPPLPEGLPTTPEGGSSIPEGTIPQPGSIPSTLSRSRRSPQLPEIPELPAGIPPVPPLPEGVPPVPELPPLPSLASVG